MGNKNKRKISRSGQRKKGRMKKKEGTRKRCKKRNKNKK